jgi:lipid-binding SYLF domain-containing protein
MRLMALFFTAAAFITTPLLAQIKQGALVDEATGVLTESEEVIPASLLANAQGIVIAPNVVKGGIGIGVRFGHGILLVRDEAGRWRPPAFISLSGGSLGWQLGVQATDLVLVFKNRKSVQTLLSGKLTLGADASVSAGPIGRQATAGADVTLRSAVYSYSRSRGLFLGLALDGTAVWIDKKSNAVYYGNDGQVSSIPSAEHSGPLPPSATRLIEYVEKSTTAPGLVPPLTGK